MSLLTNHLTAAPAAWTLLATIYFVPSPPAQRPLADLEDSDPFVQSSRPADPVRAATRFYVSAFSSVAPSVGAVVRSDGTAAGTFVVDQTAFGRPESLVTVGDDVYYDLASPGGDEVRVSRGDGSPSVLLAEDIGLVRLEGRVGNLVLLSAMPNGSGPEPWVTDGTYRSARPLRQIDPNPANPGSLYTGPTQNQFLEFAGRAWFPANDGSLGNELWATDGTTAGTVLVGDFEPGPGSSDPHGFVVGGGRMWFRATTSTHGAEIWSSDGTASGTSLFVDLVPGATGSEPEDLVYAAGLLYCRARDASGVLRMFSIDTTTGVVQIASRIAFDPPAGSEWQNAAALGRELVFLADAPGGGVELWATSGTASSARRLLDLGDVRRFAQRRGFVEHQGALYFVAESDQYGVELHRTDGTPLGTARVLDLNPGPDHGAARVLTSFGGHVYFAGDDGARGEELYRTDGTEAGTELVADLAADPSAAGSDPQFAPGSGPLFAASTGAHGREPYLTDGTAAGTQLLADLAPGTANSDPSGFRRIGPEVWFSADDGTRGRELYLFDGSQLRSFDLVPGAGGSAPGGFTPVGAHVVFASRSAASPLAPVLWSSDRTVSGTQPVPGVGQVFAGPVSLGGRALFTATPVGNPSDAELWITDGTAAGTGVLFDIEPAGSGNPELFTRAGAQVFFRAFQAATGFELWCSDGTAAGTRLVKDIDPRPGISSSPQGLVAVGDRVYFFAVEPTAGRELWVSDGTQAGTRLVADTVPGPAWPFRGALEIVASGERLFFVQDDGTHGDELWTSDGTSAGTHLVVDLVPGRSSAIGRTAGVLAPVGSSGVVVFEASDPAGDVEPWISDGTAAGTRRLRDIDRLDSSRPAVAGSGGFVVRGRKILFSADDGQRGREPWILDVAELGQPLAFGFGTGCSASGLGPFVGAATPPRLGSVFDVTLTGAVAQRPAILVWGARPANLSLGGCTLLVDDAAVVGVGSTGALGSTSEPLLLPNLAELLGGELYFQWAVDEPGGPVLGVVSLSDALLAVLGR